MLRAVAMQLLLPQPPLPLPGHGEEGSQLLLQGEGAEDPPGQAACKETDGGTRLKRSPDLQ